MKRKNRKEKSVLKNIKKSAIILLCFCVMAGMTISASAYEGKITNIPMMDRVGNYGYLNVYGYNTIENNRNVCVWQADGSDSQLWRFDGSPGGERVIRSVLNTSYCLNPDRRIGQNWNAIVYQYYNNEYDSAMIVSPYFIDNDHIGSVISLKNWKDFYLKSDGYSNGSNAHFVYITANDIHDQWQNYLWDIYAV